MSAANLFPAAALLITVIRILLILKVVILTQPMNQLLFIKIPLLHLPDSILATLLLLLTVPVLPAVVDTVTVSQPAEPLQQPDAP